MHHWQPALIPRFCEFTIEVREGNIFAVVSLVPSLILSDQHALVYGTQLAREEHTYGR